MEHAFPPPFRWQALSPGELLALGVAVVMPVLAVVGVSVLPRLAQKLKRAVIWSVFGTVCAILWYGLPAAFDHSRRHEVAVAPLLNLCFAVSMVVSILGCCGTRLWNYVRREDHAVTQILLGFFLLAALWGLLGPLFDGPASRRPSQCRNNLKQIGLALHNYQSTYGLFPASQAGETPVSWRVQVLPFIDEERLYGQYDLESPWDGRTNSPIARTEVRAFNCLTSPGSADSDKRYFTDYAMLTGNGAFSQPDQPRPVDAVTDGLANTLAVTEVSGLNIVWTEPRDASLDEYEVGVNLAGDDQVSTKGILSGWHPGGAHGLLADGAVRFLSEDIDPQVLKALTTIAGGEPVDDF